MSDIKEKNPMMEAINSMKQAVSAIEKHYTMQEGTRTGEQDGNMGETVDGEQDYSKFENVAKKKKLISAMMGE
ncbi:MAG: hypothetical protein OM95_06890 [Bdellovibrio sp. ArHS]|uniref:hypothetical protein n=1 Tax=Bdellovibrio sp. ArHS TaxID=1569284 RepID=UPI000583AB4B|nr:hypothetical protein [Bdellovibrio sp. ArHS]KHD88836.1 MAG: hypothetical protein OM95_06890 [Bdellovibrio sp. ArHS]